VTGAVELQVAALLARVHRVRDERIGELRAVGAGQVEALRADAHREARRLLRAATRDKRERVRERCRQALAELDAARRRRAFDAERRLIDTALALLPGALERRWADPTARRAWCAQALRLAAARLVERDWRIALATDASADERAALKAAAAAAGARAEFAPRAPRAGLAVSAGPSLVDATVPALLADRAAIAARLLALLLPGETS
jgi:hypothetical protein